MSGMGVTCVISFRRFLLLKNLYGAIVGWSYIFVWLYDKSSVNTKLKPKLSDNKLVSTVLFSRLIHTYNIYYFKYFLETWRIGLNEIATNVISIS